MVTDRELGWIERYGHLRANVPLRRTAYGWFVVLAVIAFIVGVVDIIYLDDELMYGVFGAFGVIFLWGLLLLASRKKKEDILEFQVADTMDLQEEYLRCPECRHVFQFDMEHRDDRKDVNFTCPECAFVGKLPPADREPVPAAVPGGTGEGPAFVCDECGEHWRVGTLGHDPKEEVRFSACPHCGEKENFSLLQDDDPQTPY